MTEAPGASRRDSTLSSVRNAARLLKEFGVSDRQIGVTDLARRLNLSKSTAHRLLHTLAEEGLLDQDPATGAYHLSAEVFVLGCGAHAVAEVREVSGPVLDHVRSMTRETVEIVVRDGRHVIPLDRRDGPTPRARRVPVGHRQDVLATSSGLVLLAFLPPARLEEFLISAAEQPDPGQGQSPRASLRLVLAQVRDRGWAEVTTGPEAAVTSIAAPVRDAHGDVVAAISVSGPAHRLTGDVLRAAIRPTVDGGITISKRLGYRDTTDAG